MVMTTPPRTPPMTPPTRASELEVSTELAAVVVLGGTEKMSRE